MLGRVFEFFKEDLWKSRLSEIKGAKKFFVKWLRISVLSYRGFLANNCSEFAGALSYYTLMSIVPIFALLFGVLRLFHLEELFRSGILVEFQGQYRALSEVFTFAETLLQQTQSTSLAFIGFATFIVIAFLTLNSIDNILNVIWKVKDGRSLSKMVRDYFLLMVITPILFFVAIVVSFAIRDIFELVLGYLPSFIYLGKVAVKLIPYFVFGILFFIFYKIMPNTKVRTNSAFVSAVFMAIFYPLLQFTYIFFQEKFINFGSFYGSLASLPLFLIWVQLSWYLFLIGAELGCAYQTVEDHEFEEKTVYASYSLKKSLALWILHLGLEKPLDLYTLNHTYKIPTSILIPVIDLLKNGHLLQEVEGKFLVDQKVLEMSILDCVELIETAGKDDLDEVFTQEFTDFKKELDAFRHKIKKQTGHMRIKNVPHSF
jgi:membrane protein